MMHMLPLFANHRSFHAVVQGEIEPTTFFEAITHEKRRHAMQQEIDAHETKSTWILNNLTLEESS